MSDQATFFHLIDQLSHNATQTHPGEGYTADGIALDFLDQCFEHADGDHLLWWRPKHSDKRYLGLGQHLLVKERTQLHQAREQHPYLFGALTFDQLKSPLGQQPWDGFHNVHFVVPEYLMIQEKDRVTVHRLGQGQQPLSSFFAATTDAQLAGPLEPHGVTSSPDEWHELTGRALQTIERKALQKVVLSTMTTYQGQRPLNPRQAFNRARQMSPHTYEFYLQRQRHHAFFSLTPETLYKQRGRQVAIDALAGTRARSSDPSRDQELAHELMASDKEQREHEHVCQHIERTLSPLGLVTRESCQVLKLSTVQHLYTPMSLELAQQTEPLALIDYLHPTPAVAGSPREEAKTFIRQHEPYGRGFYAAPVGHLIRDEQGEQEEFAVAIRSVLIDHQHAYLFGGCGIVEGSDSGQEWQEIEHKTKHLLQALRGSP